MMESTTQSQIFDRALLARRKKRAAALAQKGNDFLFREVETRLTDRLQDINRDFSTVLDIGGEIPSLKPDAVISIENKAFQNDLLSVRETSFDLVVSNLSLHHINDLPGLLIQTNRALKPDRLFLATMLGGMTLHELRHTLSLAEEEVCGGVSPRISPMVDVRDAGSLLQRAGFAMPVSDSERLTVSYRDIIHLMHDLRAMGETNILHDRRRIPMSRSMLARAGELYTDLYGQEDGRITATFEIVTLTGWSPGPGQPRPKRPGSATHRLADALGTKEKTFKS